MFVNGLNTNIQVLSVHMSSIGKSSNDVANYVKKLEGVKQVGQDNALSKMSHNTTNFNGSYYSGQGQKTYPACPIRSALLASISGLVVLF